MQRFNAGLSLFFLFAFLFINIERGYAAFPVRNHNVITSRFSEQNKISSSYAVQPADTGEKREGHGGMAALSIVLGGISIGLAALSFNAGVNLLICGLGLIAGFMAISFGSKALERKYSGFAYGGLVLGILGVTALAVLIVLALLSISI
jgi:hypothetical protein